MTAISSLPEFHDIRMDGFTFCKKVSVHFEALKNLPDGVNRLRLRKEKSHKKFAEEVIPLAHYVRRIYSLGLNLSVKWVDGDQNYDAIIFASGTRVERKRFPKKRYVELTTVVHENEYLVREHLTKNGFAYGARSMSRDPKTGETVSSPSVFGGSQPVSDLQRMILEQISKKSKKPYPRGTDLVLQCKADILVYEYEWNEVVSRLRESLPKNKFGTIVIMDIAEDYFSIIQSPKQIAW